LPVPGRKYTFGVVKAAQARGDFDVLVQRDRRALRVHLEDDVAAGLSTLRADLLTAIGYDGSQPGAGSGARSQGLNTTRAV